MLDFDATSKGGPCRVWSDHSAHSWSMSPNPKMSLAARGGEWQSGRGRIEVGLSGERRLSAFAWAGGRGDHGRVSSKEERGEACATGDESGGSADGERERDDWRGQRREREVGC